MAQEYKRKRRPYVPSDLSGTEDRIRVLSLLPGVYNDPIQIVLTTHNMDYAPPYEALSYVWGRIVCREPAIVDKCELKITQNLDTALRHLRHRQSPRSMWIDAICIDQGNVQEINHQVQLMARIYSEASQVVVWLGPAADGSNFVMDHILPEPIKEINMTSFLYYADKLINRSWFSRVWVVQEVALASMVVMQCGDRIKTLSQFIEVIQAEKPRYHLAKANMAKTLGWGMDLRVGCQAFLRETRPLRVREDMSGTLDIDMDEVFQNMVEHSLPSFDRIIELQSIMKEAHKGSLSLTRLYRLTAYRQSSDPRDKIYSLLGMTDPISGGSLGLPSLRILPDYSKPTSFVYSQAMAAIILEDFDHGYPDLPLRRYTKSKIPDLPS